MGAHHDALADEGYSVDQLVRARVSVKGSVRATATAHASPIHVEPWIMVRVRVRVRVRVTVTVRVRVSPKGGAVDHVQPALG